MKIDGLYTPNVLGFYSSRLQGSKENEAATVTDSPVSDSVTISAEGQKQANQIPLASATEAGGDPSGGPLPGDPDKPG